MTIPIGAIIFGAMTLVLIAIYLYLNAIQMGIHQRKIDALDRILAEHLANDPGMKGLTNARRSLPPHRSN